MWEPRWLHGWYTVFISSCMHSSLPGNGASLRSELGSSRDSAAIEMLHAAKVVGRSSEAEGPVIGGWSVNMSENSSELSFYTVTTWCCQYQWLDVISKLVELRACLCMICKATSRLLSSTSRAKSGFVADAHELLDSEGLSPGLSKFKFMCRHSVLKHWKWLISSFNYDTTKKTLIGLCLHWQGTQKDPHTSQCVLTLHWQAP